MKITMAHGSGGKSSAQLMSDIFGKYFKNQILDKMEDAAVLEVKSDCIEAVVREHYALGCAGRSAGERNCGKIILAVFHGLGLNANAGSGKLRPCQHLIARRDLRSRHFELL